MNRHARTHTLRCSRCCFRYHRLLTARTHSLEFMPIFARAAAVAAFRRAVRSRFDESATFAVAAAAGHACVVVSASQSRRRLVERHHFDEGRADCKLEIDGEHVRVDERKPVHHAIEVLLHVLSVLLLLLQLLKQFYENKALQSKTE